MVIIKLKTALATCLKSPEQFQHIMCIASEAKLYIRNKTQNHKNDSPVQNKTKQAERKKQKEGNQRTTKINKQMNERIGGGEEETGKNGKDIIKINYSSAFYKVVVNNKILKAVESPLQ
jgi:hypothetical protein